MSDNTATNHAQPRDSMGMRLPCVIRTLRESDVRYVIASYRSCAVAVAFVHRDGRTVFLPNGDDVCREIGEVLRSLIKQRYPQALANKNDDGVFTWDIEHDTLEHEHTIVRHGL